ncbi:MAG: selenocysteine-specific translation elongation factor [Bacteroidales bacterium]|nr:selenocysteine-specific translation elongation factor [Bacteroidales bacterium]
MKHLIIGTAGHIDHGKTALIKALTSIDCDTHKEEKLRGITINLGFAHLNLPGGQSIGIIDVPGHSDFINTMVGGTCGIDMVLLVIAADSGIMPQTAEHVNIITALGISNGVVALAKTDLVDEELIEMARYEISDFLDKTSLKNAPIVPVSCVTGQGIDELINAIEQMVSGIQEPEKGNLFRMYIDRIFTVKGFGSVVTGSVLGGSIETGKDVFLLPGSNQKLRVRSIERHGNSVDKVVAGDRAALNLIGLKNEDYERGMLISDKLLPDTRMIDVYVALFDNASPLSLWSNVTFISGTFESQARLHLLNKDEVMPGENAVAQIHLYRPAILMNRDKFIIRNSSADLTLGGGYIIDASPLHHKRRTPRLIDYLNRLSVSLLSDNSVSEIISVELKKEFRPFSLAEMAEKLNMSVTELKTELESGKVDFTIYLAGDTAIVIDPVCDKTYRDKIIDILKEHHARNSIFPGGLELNEIISKSGMIKMKQGKIYLEILLKELKSENAVENFKNTWIIKGHKPLIDKQMMEEINWLENTILKYDNEKPALSEIEEKASQTRISPPKIKIYLNYLADEGKIRFYQSEFIHTKILDKYRILLLQELQKSVEGIDIQEFKDLMGGTKRFRALLGDIFESEKCIAIRRGSGVETRFFITENGKKILHESLS